MALVFMDGFDLYNNASDLNLTYSGSGINFTTSGGRFGGGALQTNSGGYQLILPQAVPADAWYGFSLNMPSSGGAGVLAMISSVGGWEMRIDLTPGSGKIEFFRGNDNFSYGSYSGLTAGGWHWIDIHLDISGSGTAELWVDGVQVINYSGQTYQNNSTGPYTWQWGNNGIAGPNVTYIDDWVINNTSGTINNGRIGDSRIEAVVPTSDAGPNDGTPSTGTDHFACVDEAQWSSTDYVTLPNVSGDAELYGVGALTGSVTTVSAVQVLTVAEKDDTGTGTLELEIKSGSTTTAGSSISLSPGWTRYGSIFETDPNTSAAWANAAAVNAAKVGFKTP